ncbi:MAG: GNAT family N-acetyltransferase, partial [Holophagales bacterium]|nr:GNAT family N-acetyltransferase [Holophagales bacterium]
MTGGEIRIEPGDPDDRAFVRLHEALDRELGELYPADSIYSVEPDKLDAPGCCLLLGRNAEGEAVACGALRRLSAEQAEIKRMYVVPEYRGQALGRRILEELESRAAAFGYKSLR